MQDRRLQFALWGVLCVVGFPLSFGRGQLPRRGEPVEGSAGGVAPDLALYAEMIQEVRSGRGYYDVAREKIPPSLSAATVQSLPGSNGATPSGFEPPWKKP